MSGVSPLGPVAWKSSMVAPQTPEYTNITGSLAMPVLPGNVPVAETVDVAPAPALTWLGTARAVMALVEVRALFWTTYAVAAASVFCSVAVIGQKPGVVPVPAT